jgi:phage-related protein
VTGIGLLIAAGMALMPIFTLMTAAAGAFGLTMLPLIGWILGIVAAIALLVAGGVWLYNNWDMVMAKAKELIDKTNAWFEEWKDGVRKRFFETIDAAKEMVAKINKAFEDWKDGVRRRFNESIQSIKDLWNGLMEFFRGIDLRKIGRDIIQGLANGISEMKDKVFEKAREIADGVGKKIRKALEIGSPSRLTEYFGEMTGEGLVEGMRHSLNAISSMSNKMAAAAVPDTPKINANGSGSAGNALTVNLHSPRALDVREAAKQFNRTLNKMSLMW